MIEMQPLRPFQPNLTDAAGIISWAHLGDLHMTLAGEQNYLDLVAIVTESNKAFDEGPAFIFLPGDVADHGNAWEYRVVRQALDTLKLP